MCCNYFLAGPVTSLRWWYTGQLSEQCCCAMLLVASQTMFWTGSGSAGVTAQSQNKWHIMCWFVSFRGAGMFFTSGRGQASCVKSIISSYARQEGKYLYFPKCQTIPLIFLPTTLKILHMYVLILLDVLFLPHLAATGFHSCQVEQSQWEKFIRYMWFVV